MGEIELTKNFKKISELNYDDYSDVMILENQNSDYTSFFEKNMLKNVPCVIRNVSLSWECSKYWIKNETINHDYFIQRYGDLEAPVAICDSFTYNAQNKINMKVCDFMHYLEKSHRDKLLYLKDWHLRRLQPHDKFYEVPLLFSSDWLNEFATDHEQDDFMFVYIGPKDSWTPLHVDVYYSYSWSVNVVGQKKWILFPPGEEDKLKDPLDNLPLLFKPEKFKNIKYIEIIQEKGDAIFIPTGWHHQVTNLLDTISINHNWINACNIEPVWKALTNSLSSVEDEIEEFKNTPEYISQCQLILKSLFGMDISSFVVFVSHIAKKRLSQLEGNEFTYFNNIRLGINHLKFDLTFIFQTINLIYNHPLILNKDVLTTAIENDFLKIKCRISKIMQEK